MGAGVEAQRGGEFRRLRQVLGEEVVERPGELLLGARGRGGSGPAGEREARAGAEEDVAAFSTDGSCYLL